jgi:hypothetical protein
VAHEAVVHVAATAFTLQMESRQEDATVAPTWV